MLAVKWLTAKLHWFLIWVVADSVIDFLIDSSSRTSWSQKETISPPPPPWNTNSEVSSSLCFTWVVQVTFFSFQKSKRILHPTFFFFYCDFEPVMQEWLSLEAFLYYHYACFRSLSISRVSSLSGGSLTVTIKPYCDLEPEASRLHEVKIFQGIISWSFVFCPGQCSAAFT